MGNSSTVSFVRLGTCALLAVAITQCGSTKSGPNAPSSAGSASIGASGGTVTSADGHLRVAVPPNALTGDITVTVTPTTQSGAIGTVYDVGPSGTQFAVPVTMTLAFADVDLGKTPANYVRMSVYGANGWETLSNQALDANAKTVSGTTMHLTPYGATAACFDVSGGWGCGGGSSCPPPACADVNACGGYPGAAVTSCSVSPSGSGGTFQATCCFPPNAPVCIKAGPSQGCGAAGSSGGGAGGGTCVPPTCAQATCTSGTSLQSCTDSANGFDATCCYPVGVLPPPSVANDGGSGGGGAPGGSGGGGGAPGGPGG